jgi:hypothetical protein
MMPNKAETQKSKVFLLIESMKIDKNSKEKMDAALCKCLEIARDDQVLFSHLWKYWVSGGHQSPIA